MWDLVWWGQGRWDWNTVYELPVPTRKFFIKKMNEVLYKKMNPSTNTQNKTNTDKIVRGPDIKNKR